VGEAAVVVARPEDLVAGSGDGGITARVTAIEYRGRAFFGAATSADGSELFFRSETRLALGTTVQLRVAPERALAFAENGQ